MELFNRFGLLSVILLATACERQPTPVTIANESHGRAPELSGGFTWLNSPAVELAALRGKVVLLCFFDYSCAHSLRTLPCVRNWEQRYRKHGLVVVGVHVPQYEFAMHPNAVYAGVQRLGLSFPIVVDSNFAIADAYMSRAVPRLCLIDTRGAIRFDATGEGICAETERRLQQLLRELKPVARFPEPLPSTCATNPPVTPDLFLGRERGGLANADATTTNAAPEMFTLPWQMTPEQVYAAGQWERHAEYLRHTRDVEELTDCVAVTYHGVAVNVVMKPEGIFWLQVFVQQDGQWLRREVAGPDIKFDERGRSLVEVRSARLYQLTANELPGLHELRLFVHGKGLSVYQFDFATCKNPPGRD